MCEHYYICVTGWKTNAGTFNTLSGCGSKRPPAPPGLHLISIQGGGVGRSSQKHSESTLLKYIPPLSEDINLSHQKVCVCHLCVKHLTQIKLSPCAHIQRGNKSSLPGGTKQLLISLWEADGVLINTNSSMITAIQNKRPRLQPDGTNSPRSPQFTCRTLHRSVTSAGPTNTLAPYAQICSGDSPVFYNQSINHQSAVWALSVIKWWKMSISVSASKTISLQSQRKESRRYSHPTNWHQSHRSIITIVLINSTQYFKNNIISESPLNAPLLQINSTFSEMFSDFDFFPK